MAQRLVRRICPNCKDEDPNIDPEVRKDLHIPPHIKFYRGKGCNRCENTGYKGRTGIYEFLVPSEEVRNLVLRRASGDEIKRVCMTQGMNTLRMDGMEKALTGVTTLEQVLSASEKDEFKKSV